MYKKKHIIKILALSYFSLVFFAVIGIRLMRIFKFRVSHGYNLNVFADINDLGINIGAVSMLSRFDWWFNVLLFCPFPTAFRVLLPEMNLFKVWMLASFVSFCIELLQFVLHIGSADINDLLANSLGAFIGCFFSYSYKHWCLKRVKG